MNRITKKKLPVFISLGLIFALLSVSFIYPQVSKSEFGDITKKAYYQKLFSSKEIRKLDNARESNTEAYRELKEAENLFKEARTFNKIKNDARDARDQRRADRKEQRSLRQAYRTGFSAYDDIFDNYEYIFSTYDNRLRQFKNDSSNHHRFAEQYAVEGRKIYTESIAKKRMAENKKDQDRYDGYKETAEHTEKAVEYMETALMLFMKDEAVKLSELELRTDSDKGKKEDGKLDDKGKTDDTKTDDRKTKQDNTMTKDSIRIDSVQAVVYQPDEDPNVYQSKRDSILSQLNISMADSSLLKKALAKEKRADIYMDAVNYRYKKIDTLLNDIYYETDRGKKELLKQEAAQIEQVIFVDLIVAANLYLEANDIVYEVYSKNFDKARPKSNADKRSKGLSYEDNARELKLMAKSSTVNANLKMYAAEKYLQLMNSIQLQLSAIQEQENAYSVYYEWPVVPLRKTFKTRYNTETAESGIKTGTKKPDDDKNSSSEEKPEYSFNLAGSYFYTKQNPTPQELKPVEGTVFKIQVGIYKRLLSPETFGNYSPISYDVFENNPYKRFMVGEYISREAAEYALGTIKKQGIDDAFIVAYTNGKRQSYKAAAKKITADSDYQKKVDEEMAELKNTTKKSGTTSLSYPDFISYGNGPDDFVRGQDISETKGLKYTVQVGMYKLPKTNKDMQKAQPLYREVTPDGIKYLSGLFGTYDRAKVHEKNMHGEGFAQAFVSAYLDGDNISLTRATAVKSDAGKSEDKTAQPNVYFSVQVGAYSSILPPEKEAELNKLSKHYTISSKTGPNGLIIYTIGQFLRYEDAKALARELQAEHPDIFVVAFKNEIKISVSEAIKLTEK